MGDEKRKPHTQMNSFITIAGHTREQLLYLLSRPVFSLLYNAEQVILYFFAYVSG